MALAEYFDRAAQAAAHAIAGFDPGAFRDTLERAHVGVTFGAQAATRAEGRALLDLTVRLLARLYPSVRIATDSRGGLDADLAATAREINPRIDISEGEVSHVIVVGDDAPRVGRVAFFVGSEQWQFGFSAATPISVGRSPNPIGAGGAACLGAANLFRSIVQPTPQLDRDLRVSVAELLAGAGVVPDLRDVRDDGRTALAGLGAIGNGVVWTLARTPLEATLHTVDAQVHELSNLQRYVLPRVADVGKAKVDLAREHLAAGAGRITCVPHRMRWGAFVNAEGFTWDRVLVALDSAHDRRLLQSSLPRWIANGWTQVGDLGVSTHRFDGSGPCLICLYLEHGQVMSEDEQVVRAFGLSVDDPHLKLVRDLLYRGAPPPRTLLEEISHARSVDMTLLEPYAERPLRALYVDGVCGGGVISLSQQATPGRDAHVPLAHQSALAGIFIAAAYLLDVLGIRRDTRQLLHLNPMRRFPDEPVREFTKDARCVCNDEAFVGAYRAKYPPRA
ncbi:MAG: hypothetical protein AUH44_01765 [Chloroflexi bacterium 13_1_40CM_68_15]|nr:MAG: hypothetical protein AUH44_01765 [Chloroflexi bacterium 13_1_40CM_68_15]